MAKVTGAHPAVAELASALGLDPHGTRSVDLRMHVDEAVTAIVEQFVTDDELGELVAVVRKYRMVLEPEESVEQ